VSSVVVKCVSEFKDFYQTEIITKMIIGSRPSDHYFRSVSLSVCLCRVFLSRL